MTENAWRRVNARKTDWQDLPTNGQGRWWVHHIGRVYRRRKGMNFGLLTNYELKYTKPTWFKVGPINRAPPSMRSWCLGNAPIIIPRFIPTRRLEQKTPTLYCGKGIFHAHSNNKGQLNTPTIWFCCFKFSPPPPLLISTVIYFIVSLHFINLDGLMMLDWKK